MCCPETTTWGDAENWHRGQPQHSLPLPLLLPPPHWCYWISWARAGRRGGGEGAFPAAKSWWDGPWERGGSLRADFRGSGVALWVRDCGPKRKVLKMLRKWFLEKTEKWHLVPLRFFSLLFAAPFCLLLFGVQVMCVRQRISHCNSEKEEGRLNFLNLYVTLKPHYFFGGLIQTKPIELIFHWFH